MMTQLTIATPFAGKETPWIDRWVEVEAALLRHSPAYVLWLDNSRDEGFHALLQEAKRRLPVPVRIVCVPLRVGKHPTPGLETDTIVRLLWQAVAGIVETPHLLCMESDVLAPADAIDHLADGLDHAPPFAAVSGAIAWWGQDGTHHTQVWRRLPALPAQSAKPTGAGLVEIVPQGPAHPRYAWWPKAETGVEVVDATPFGCLYLRTETLRDASLSTPQFPPGYDQHFGHEMSLAGRAVAVCWDVKCGHIKLIKGEWKDYA